MESSSIRRNDGGCKAEDGRREIAGRREVRRVLDGAIGKGEGWDEEGVRSVGRGSVWSLEGKAGKKELGKKGEVFFFQTEDGIRGISVWLEFRRVLFRSIIINNLLLIEYVKKKNIFLLPKSAKKTPQIKIRLILALTTCSKIYKKMNIKNIRISL